MQRVVLLCWAALSLMFVFGCRHQTQVPELSPEPRLNAFVQDLARSLEAHAWEDILAVADPDHYRSQVTEHGMPEAQYVAELFGLHRTGNNIRQGRSVTWSDLERIEEVRIEALTAEGDRHTLTGGVRLRGGGRLQIEAWIVQRQGEYRLTGGFG